MKRTKIAAIDVGTTKVSTIIADVNGTADLRILGVGVAASYGLEKGVVVNARDAAASISESVRQAEKMAGCRLGSSHIGISGTNMSSLTSQGTISIPRHNQLVRASDRKRALEVAQSLEIPDDRRLLHVIPRSYTLDGQGNIRNPVGMHGFRLNVETYTITMNAISAQNLTKCIRRLGIGIDGLILKSLANIEAVLTEDERQTGVMLADIGGATTEIAVLKNGSVYHTSTLPIGGHHVTSDIAVGLGLPFDLAEEMKKRYGNVMPSEEKVDSDVTVAENGYSVSYRDLYEIIEARIEELLRLIVFQIPGTDDNKAVPSRLVLTGGSCKLTGIAELGHKVTHLPVRIGIPLNLDDDNETLQDPAYTTSIGLLYWKMKNEDPQAWWGKRVSLRGLLPRLQGYFSTMN